MYNGKHKTVVFLSQTNKIGVHILCVNESANSN